MLARSRWKRAFQFSLSGMLLVTACLCGYLGSHRLGERAGAKQRYDESFFTKPYSIADLLVETPSDEDRARVYAETTAWLQARVPFTKRAQIRDGQSCEFTPFDANGSLYIRHYGAGHDAIEVALAEFRRERHAQRVAAAIGEIDGLPSQTADQPVVLVNYPGLQPLALAAVEQRYVNLVTELTERWGAADYSGACTDADFPAWSASQSLSIWSRDGGETYLAVQDLPEVGRALIAGRREE